MNSTPLQLRELEGRFAVARLEAAAPIPDWGNPGRGSLISITRTRDETSIVAPDDVVPNDVRAERDFIAFAVIGPLDFSLTGILAQLTAPLAEASIPVFAISTFDTDYLLVRAAHREAARGALGRVAMLRN